MRASPSPFWRAALFVLALLVLRDAVAVFLHGLGPAISQVWLRAVDLSLLLFHVGALAVWLRSRFVGLVEKCLAIGLHLCVLLSTAMAGDPGAHLRSIRETVLVLGFLFAGWIVGSRPRSVPVPSKATVTLLLGLMLVSVPIGVIQRLFVTQIGDYWFTDYLSTNRDIFDEFNYIREEVSRATGLGFSPFALGYLGLGAGMLALTLHTLRRASGARDNRAGLHLLQALCLAACFLAGTRLAAASLVVMLLLAQVPRRWTWWLLAAMLALGLVYATVVDLDNIGDTSLWGRVEQWGGFIADSDLLRPFGSGFATGPGEIWFDSFGLNFTLTFGPLASALVLALVVTCIVRGRHSKCMPALAAVFIVQYLLQSLEYTLFMPALLASLGLVCGAAARDASQSLGSGVPLAVGRTKPSNHPGTAAPSVLGAGP